MATAICKRCGHFMTAHRGPKLRCEAVVSGLGALHGPRPCGCVLKPGG